MTPELDNALTELDQLMGAERLARPSHPLAEPGDGRRDPSPVWDYWYERIGRRERAELLQFMAPAGRGNGIALDQLAAELFCSVDTACETWRGACQAVRTARRHARTAARTVAEQLADPSSDLYAAEWEQFDAEQLRRAELAILGPQELAEQLGRSPAVIHQWRRRGKLPAADLIVSGVPLWHVDTLKGCEIL